MLILSAEFLKSAPFRPLWPADGPPEVAFCGRSNVGKSSCLNALAERKALARVSNTPGRTRLINFFDLKVCEKTRSGGRGKEHVLRLVDLPGYGFAEGAKSERAEWRRMIEEYLTKRDSLRALVVLIDGELGPQPNDLEMLAWSRTLPRRLLVVATKLDRLPKTRRTQQLENISKKLAMPVEDVLGFSAKESIGVDELWRALVKAAEAADIQV
jgi:GTP-binding protein